jgi:pyruvate dehydrogenase phosphatase
MSVNGEIAFVSIIHDYNSSDRIQSEHSKDEAGDVIRDGRVLGGLEPSRAFGDARYKWPREIQQT